MTYGSKHDYEVKEMSQSCSHKSVSMMTRSNHADKNINKSENEIE